MRVLFGLASACLIWVGCSSTELSGSIGELLSLKYDELRIRKQWDDLVVEYLYHASLGTEKVCKLVLNTAGLDLSRSRFKLEGEQFKTQVDLQRATYANDSFPAIERGDLDIHQLNFRDDGSVEGQFFILFVTQRNLTGRFEGIIEGL